MAISHKPSRFRNRGRRAAPARLADERPKTGFVLTVVDGPNVGKEYFFEKNAGIGRVETNDIVLVEPGISRNHARIYDDQGVFVLEDLGSANGTRLNGEKVGEPEVLRDGDYVTLSQTTLQFSMLTAARGDVTSQTSLSEVEKSVVDATSTREDAEPKRGLRGFLGSRRGKVILGLLLVAGTGIGYYFKQRATDELIQSDLSDVPLTYSDEPEFFNAVYGNGRYDQTHPRSVVIDFDYLGGRATLRYGAWGIDKVGEVTLLLNDKEVGQAPMTGNRWVYGKRLVLPREHLRKGKSNRISFINTMSSSGETWELCYVEILQEAIPPPDPVEARTQFELAKKAWEDQDIEPGNLSTALEGFKRARDLLEGLAQRPALYQDALDYIDKVDAALTDKFSAGIFSGRRAEKDGDLGRARSTLLYTLRYFQKDDFRHRALEKYLEELVAQE